MRLTRRAWVGAGAGVVVVALGVAAIVAGSGGDGDEVLTDESSTTTTEDPVTTASSSTSSTSSSTTTRPTTTRPTTSTVAPTTVPPTAPPTTAHPLRSARIRLTPIANLDYPIAMAVFPGDGGLWIARKGGFVCRLQAGGCGSEQKVANVSTGNEQGLLGIAFNPSGTRFYASYTNTDAPIGDTRVDEFTVGANGAPVVGSRRQVYAHDQPQANHNGGNIVFGPDGRLYLGLGDGGGGGDQHGSIGNGQDPSTDLGKVLRIDPTRNPVVVQRWISGVRNPWRFSFDRASGDLWLGDVGQGEWEEIDLLRAGQQQGRNLGWRCFEGTHRYSSCGPIDHTPPIFEYSHAEGCSITGGYVYRGSRVPALVGSYLFADYCDGEIRALAESGGRVVVQRRLGVDAGNVVSFGQDAAGELYVLTPTRIFRVDQG